MQRFDTVTNYNISVKTTLITEFSRSGIDAVFHNGHLDGYYENWSLQYDITRQNSNDALWDGIIKWINHKEIKQFTQKDTIGEKSVDVIVVCINKSEIDFDVLIYFLSLLYHVNSHYKVCFYTNDKADNNYFKLSALLTLWLAQNRKQNDIKYYNPNNKKATLKNFAYDYGPKKGKIKVREYHISTNFFPIVEIRSSIYSVLDEDFDIKAVNDITNTLKILNDSSTLSDNAYANYFRAYVSEYIKRIWSDIKKSNKKLYDLMLEFYETKPPLLVAVLYSIITVKMLTISDENILIERRERLVENCFAYVQGIMQLIENAKIHVVENKLYDDSGRALFGFYIDKFGSVKKHYLLEDVFSFEEKCGYFLRFTIMDCIPHPTQDMPIGIVERFNTTLKENIDAERYEDGLHKIKELNEIFDYPNCVSPALEEYYSNFDNIAYHYGLQIFDNVVTANSGLFIVESGRAGYTSFYSNADKSFFDQKPLYIKSISGTYNSFSGTECFILIPIIQTDDINIGDMSLGNESIDYSVEYPVINEKIRLQGNGNNDINFFLSQMGKSTGEIAHFDIESITDRKQLEITCKAALKTIVSNKKLKTIALTGFRDENMLLNAVRIISLFYDKTGHCSFMQTEDGTEKGIFLYGIKPGGRDIELYFHGRNIGSAMENIERQKILKQIPDSFYRHIMCALRGRYDSSEQRKVAVEKLDQYNKSMPSVYLKYALPYDNKLTIAQYQLREILEEDIHSDNLGCKLMYTHIRIGDVHLDTFFEAQFLFGNAYWTDVFALYVSDCVRKKSASRYCGSEKPRLILYGYETYSSMLLYKVSQILNDSFDTCIWIFEKKEDRIREIKANDNCFGDVTVFYVVGISSTLSTFQQMENALIKKADKSQLEIDIQNCMSVIQVTGKGADNFIEESRDGRSCLSKRGFLNFANGQRADFFVSVDAGWTNVDDRSGCIACKMCMPDNYLEEKPLIEVDETSVVPTQMIFLNSELNGVKNELSFRAKEKQRASIFLSDITHNSQYLYYDHIVRNNNHFQYYIRNSALYRDKCNEIEDWLTELRNDNIINNFIIDGSNIKTVNILIAPQHFSNTGFANSVNKCIFNSAAHIIEFDIRREFRSSFRAKYSNYKKLGEFLSNAEGYNINFYYVNDQIISGSTFHRAKSLIQYLLSVNDVAKQNNKINIFKGVFVLVDRNSDSTQLSYVEDFRVKGNKVIPFFSFMRFDIPSLRNHDDSCPICKQNASLQNIIDCSVFDSTTSYFQKKLIEHREKTVTQVFKELPNDIASGIRDARPTETMLNAFRKMRCENELWKAIKSINGDNKDKKTQSEEYYDEMILLLFGLQENEKTLITPTVVERITCLLPTQKRDLFNMVISRLCAIGSCALLNKMRLNRCREVGAALYEICNKTPDTMLDNDLSEYGERLIDYIKIISSPLLFYREHIKSAVLKLLLEILDIYINQLNIVSESQLQQEFYINEKFDQFLLCNLKKLLCYDKGVSKAKACDHALFGENEWNGYDRFYCMLYLENNGVELKEKDENWGRLIFSAIDEKKKDIKKYSEIIKQIKNCISTNNSECKIAMFAPYAACNGDLSYIHIAGDVEVPLPDGLSNDFNYDFKECLYYISIGNNYEEIATDVKCNAPETKEHILRGIGLTQTANILLGVKTKNLHTLRKILTYRKEILEEIEKDFNNGTVQELIQTEVLVAALTETKALTHDSSPYNNYGKLIDLAAETMWEPKNLKAEEFGDLNDHLISQISSMFISSFISQSYRDLIKRTTVNTLIKMQLKKSGGNEYYLDFTPNTISASESMMQYFCAGAWVSQPNVAENIWFCVKMIKDEWATNARRAVHFMYIDKNDESTPLLDCSEDNIRNIFTQEYAMRTLVQELTVHSFFSLYMLVNIFLKNAVKHSKQYIDIYVELHENRLGGVDLNVKNKITKDVGRATQKPGITLVSLANFFGYGNDFTGDTRIKWEDNGADFIVSIKNLIIKE